MNAMAKAAIVDWRPGGSAPTDPDEPLFPMSYRQTAIFLGRAVERAMATLKDAGKATTRLDGYTWHSNRHSFASRLVMAGVDLRTIQELGGWQTLALVARYGHMSPDHLRAAVDRIGGGQPVEAGLKLDSRQPAPAEQPAEAR